MSTDKLGAVYMLIGTRHAVQLLVSIDTLRTQAEFLMPVCILCGDQASAEVAERLAIDKSLAPITVKRFPHQPQRNGAYAAKTRVPDLQPFDRFVFFDADTSFRQQPVVGLFTDEHTIHLTQFCDWLSTGKIISGRIKKFAKDAPREVERMLSAPFKAINTGVFAGPRQHTFWGAWREMTLRRLGDFIVDEIAAQLVYPDHDVRVFDDCWNYSPRFSDHPKDSIRIVHYHGRKHVRDAGGREMWMRLLDSVLRRNVARANDWARAVAPKEFRHYDAWLME